MVYLAGNPADLAITHFAVLLAGAVLVVTNTRLSGPETDRILRHCEARVVLADLDVDRAYADVLSAGGPRARRAA